MNEKKYNRIFESRMDQLDLNRGLLHFLSQQIEREKIIWKKYSQLKITNIIQWPELSSEFNLPNQIIGNLNEVIKEKKNNENSIFSWIAI